jgi:lipopolysaccharide export system protein LptA
MRTVRSPTRGTLTSSGRDDLSLSGDSLLAVYARDGSLASIQAQKKCSFRTDDFQGEAEAIRYDAAAAKIDISGKRSTIRNRKNVFTSGHFLILTPTRQLSGKKGVKATLVPGKKGVLLGPRPVFVTASAMETSKKGNQVRFSGDVNLFQDEIEVHAGELLFDGPGNRISCGGGADLKFSSEGETLALRGKTIAFDPERARIVIEGEARLQQGPNTLAARTIELAFAGDDKLETIDAADRVAFSKGEITGKAQILHWQYARQTVLFRNAAEITRRGAGTTRGQELRFDLASNEIQVSGADDRSQTTLRREHP